MPLDDQTKAHLESLTTTMALAFNARDFSPTSPAWKPLHPQKFLGGPFPPVVTKPLNVEDYLAHLAANCEAYPEWKFRIVDCDTQMGKDENHARVFTNVENQGVPEGVVWQSVGISEFECVEGVWWVVGYRGFAGGHGQGALF